MMISDADLRHMQSLARTIWLGSPSTLDMTVAELAYQAGLAKTLDRDSSTHSLWTTGSTCVAWGRFFPPNVLGWAVHPDAPEALAEIVEWAADQSADGTLRTTVRDGDAKSRHLLHELGFGPDHDRVWMRLNHRLLDDIEEPRLPDGYQLMTVADYDGDISKRVDVHQRSWADLGTRVSSDTYPAVMATWPYRPDLDFVLEANDGSPVAFALAWLDSESRVAEFEPLGTHPDYRRRGLGRALLLMALRRLRTAGASDALVGSRGDAGFPLPSLLYESVGFRQLSRQLPLAWE
jgi:GNAT superfamily N-acetyltransferase